MHIDPACLYKELGWVEIDPDSERCIRTTYSDEVVDIICKYVRKETFFWPDIYINKSILRKHAPNDMMTIEVEFIPHINRCPEWAPQQYIDAHIHLIRMQDFCFKHNFSAMQCHLYNVTIYKGRPLYIDLGDFKHGIHNKEYTIEPIFRDFRQSGRRFVENYDDIIVQIDKAYDTYEPGMSLLVFERIISNSQPTCRSHPWQNYHPEDLTYSSIKDRFFDKSKRICDIIETMRPRTMLDIGCNTGVYSHFASLFGTYATGIDTCAVSVEKANRIAENNKMTCSFLCFDFMSTEQAYGVHGTYRIPSDRLKSTLVIAPAFIHHMLMQNKPIDEIVDRIIKYSNKYVLIEYIPHHDPAVAWPSINEILCILHNKNYKTIVSDSYPNPRKWIFGSKE